MPKISLLKQKYPIKGRYHFLAGAVPLQEQLKQILLYLTALMVIILLGTVGYMLIEGWDLLDAAYMTVITLAAVGFNEVHPLSPWGRIFTILLIALGIGLVTALFATIAQKVIHNEILLSLQGKRMLDTLRKLKNHTIFCGYGDLAQVTLSQLRDESSKIVIIERDHIVAQSARQMGFLVVEGDATSEEVLFTAGIERASRVVTLLSNESDNVYVILACRELNPKSFILSRAETEAGEKYLSRAGASRIISPYRVGGMKIAEGLRRPYVTDFLDLAISDGDSSFQIEQIRLPADSPAEGKTLAQLDLRRITNVIITAIVQADGQMQFNPSADTKIEPGATFIAIGEKSDLLKLESLLTGA